MLNTNKTCGCKTRKQISPKWLFLHKGHSQGHNVTELGVTWKGFISWVCMPNMESLYLMVQKLWPRLNFFRHVVKIQGQGY